MTRRLYLDEQFLRQQGWPEVMVATLRTLTEYANTIERLGGVEEAAEEAALSLTSLDTRLDAAELDIDELEDGTTLDPRYVRQDQTSAWTAATGTETRSTFATFAGQSITNPPTQAEVQAIDDHVKVLSERVAALINDLKTNGALT